MTERGVRIILREAEDLLTDVDTNGASGAARVALDTALAGVRAAIEKLDAKPEDGE